MIIEKSKFDGWNTPAHILARVYAVLGEIDLDPCSNATSLVIARSRLGKEENGLGADWYDYRAMRQHFGATSRARECRVFVNPPYDQPTLQTTADHCIAQKIKGCEIITLVPSKTDQKWFADCIDAAASACFIRGRVPFGKEGTFAGSGQFACTSFYFGRNAEKFKREFSQIGACI